MLQITNSYVQIYIITFINVFVIFYIQQFQKLQRSHYAKFLQGCILSEV